MMDLTSLFTLTYGMYVVTTKWEDKLNGCTINTFSQATSEPFKVTITINKNNLTCSLIEKSRMFAVTTISEECSLKTIGTFGFKSGKDVNKFETLKYELDEQGLPYLQENMVARFSAKVVDMVDVGTHIIFIGELLKAEHIENKSPMSYSYYHNVKKGLTQKNAPTYIPDANKKTGYKCTLCGYLYESNSISEDYVCPICGANHSKFISQ